MHEASIAQAILDTVLQNSPKNIKKITQINVVANAMSSIVKESLDLHFVEASRKTIAEGAQLNLKISQVPKNYVESIEVENED